MKTKTALLIFSMLLIFYCLKVYLQCDLTDNEVTSIVQQFSTRMNIKFQPGHFFSINENKSIISNEVLKKITFGDEKEYKAVVKINCKTRELVHFSRNNILQSYRNKYMRSEGNVRHIIWPPFIEEKKAKNVLVLLANRIGLPDGAELAELSLDKNDGIWVAKWRRIYKGVAYEDFCMAVAILAVDGEFYSFNKSVEKEPKLAEIKINRSEAIAIANNNFVTFFPKNVWQTNKSLFEVKSAELNYSMESSLLNRIVHHNRPRLVWVIAFDAKEGMGRNTIGVLIKDNSVIKVDPTTGKILSKKIDIVLD